MNIPRYWHKCKELYLYFGKNADALKKSLKFSNQNKT